jgi:hypothetical protein
MEMGRLSGSPSGKLKVRDNYSTEFRLNFMGHVADMGEKRKIMYNLIS